MSLFYFSCIWLVGSDISSVGDAGSASRKIQVLSGTDGCPGPFHCPVMEPQGLGCTENIPWVLLVHSLSLESVSGQLTKYPGISEQVKFVCACPTKKKEVCILKSTSPLPKNFPGTSVLVLSRTLEGGSTADNGTFSIFTGKSKHYI